jgi:hypothetical protein
MLLELFPETKYLAFKGLFLVQDAGGFGLDKITYPILRLRSQSQRLFICDVC